MQVSRRVDYGIRAMVDIASLPPNALVATREVAERQDIPQVFLTKIITRLTRAGLIRTHRGAAGGIYLARPPQEINLLDIVEAVDGPIAINRCSRQPSACDRQAVCPSRPVWNRIQGDIMKLLADAKLSELTPR